MQKPGILRVQHHIGPHPPILKGTHDQIIAAPSVTPPRKHQRRSRQLLDTDGLRLGRRNALPVHGDEFLPGQLEHGVIGILYGKLNQREIKVPFLHMPLKGLVVHNPDTEAQIGKLPVQGGNRRAHQRKARRAYPNPHQTGDFVPAFPNVLLQTRNIGKDELRPLIQGLPFRRHLPRFPFSINKLDIKLFFEFLQAHAQRRLRNVQGFRRLADLSLFDNRAKILQTLQVHTRTPPAQPCAARHPSLALYTSIMLK